MKLDETHPANAPLIDYFRRLKPDAPPLAAPDSVPLPYMKLGSHPDIVERVWVQLNSALPVDCRAMVYGSPALVHPESGIVIALALGTRYALRIPEEQLELAMDGGCTTAQMWSGGTKTDISEEFGRGWLFGSWMKTEMDWALWTYQQVGPVGSEAAQSTTLPAKFLNPST